MLSCSSEKKEKEINNKKLVQSCPFSPLEYESTEKVQRFNFNFHWPTEEIFNFIFSSFLFQRLLISISS